MKARLLFCLLVVTVAACKQQETPAPEQATPPAAAEKPAAAPKTTGSVKATFTGAIVHLLGVDRPRAAVIRDGYHARYLIVTNPTIGSNDEDGALRLSRALGNNIKAKCSGQICVAGPLNKVAMRVADIQPTLNSAQSFTDFVPRLATDANISDVRLSLKGRAPEPKDEFPAYFLLEGGTLTAKPYCNETELKTADLEYANGMTRTRHFDRSTTLQGTTPGDPVLQFSNDGRTWRNLNLAQPSNAIELHVVNNPIPNVADMAHFHLHERVGDSADFPTVSKVKCNREPEDDVIDDALAMLDPRFKQRKNRKGEIVRPAGMYVGCSNSAWP